MTSLTENINYFQPNKFKVIVDRKNYPNLEFFAQSFTLPSVDATTAEPAFKGISSVPMPGDALNFSPLNVTILLDEDMEVYKELYNWLYRTVYENHTTAQEAFQGDLIPTMCDIIIIALTSHNNANISFRYKDAFPESLGEIELNSAEQSIEPYSLNAVFRYTNFEVE